MGLSHTSLANYYNLVFAMAHHHKYSISDIENLIPFELDIYVDMLMQSIRAKEQEV